jgi:hypothetical protein
MNMVKKVEFCRILYLGILICVNHDFQQYLSYTMTTRTIGEERVDN